MEVHVRYVCINSCSSECVRLHVYMYMYICDICICMCGQACYSSINQNVWCVCVWSWVCICLCVDRLNPSECWDRSQHRNEVNHVFRWKMVMVRDPHMDHHTHTHTHMEVEDMDGMCVCVQTNGVRGRVEDIDSLEWRCRCTCSEEDRTKK